MEQGDEDNAKTTSELHIEYDDYDDEYDEYDEDDEDLMIFLSFLVLPLREGFSPGGSGSAMRTMADILSCFRYFGCIIP